MAERMMKVHVVKKASTTHMWLGWVFLLLSCGVLQKLSTLQGLKNSKVYYLLCISEEQSNYLFVHKQFVVVGVLQKHIPTKEMK